MAVVTFRPNSLTNSVGIYAGEEDLDGSGVTTITTPFETVTSVTLTPSSATAPAVTTEAQSYSYTISGGTVSVYGWTATNSSTTTLIDPTSTDTFSFLITGY
jgi:hypothetical protein